MKQFEIEYNGKMVDSTTIGLYMGDGFLSALDGFKTLKEFVENDSRLQHGTRIVLNNPKVKARDITLPFVIYGRDEVEFRANRNIFEAMLLSGKVRISVKDVLEDDEVYTLYYKDSSPQYGMNRRRNIAKISVKFTEANPFDR